MPTLSIYVNDELYGYLLNIGKPSKIGKEWIADRYKREIEKAVHMEQVHMGLDGEGNHEI